MLRVYNSAQVLQFSRLNDFQNRRTGPPFLKLREVGLKETFHTITNFTFYVVTLNNKFKLFSMLEVKFVG